MLLVEGAMTRRWMDADALWMVGRTQATLVAAGMPWTDNLNSRAVSVASDQVHPGGKKQLATSFHSTEHPSSNARLARITC